MGCEKDEVLDAFRQSPELFELDREQLEEWALEVRELFPEYNLGEHAEGSTSETRSEMNVEIEPPDNKMQEGRWRGRRM